MSISNLLLTDINSVNIACNVTGAITGTTTLNLKRFDNIVYGTFATIAGSANNTQPTITITTTGTIPSRYLPVETFARPVSLVNIAVPVLGLVLVASNLSTFTYSLSAGGNFNGNAAIKEDVLLWKVNTV